MFKKILTAPIRFYKKWISPLLPDACRFEPTCSEYALCAIEKHGAKGLLLAAYRILRCNPFCEGGYDPVPDTFTFKRDRNSIESEEDHKIEYI